MNSSDTLQIIEILIGIIALAGTAAYITVKVKKNNSVVIKGNKIKGNNNSVTNNIGIDEQAVDAKLETELKDVHTTIMSETEPEGQETGGTWRKPWQ